VFRPHDYSRGLQLKVPGSGTQQVLEKTSSSRASGIYPANSSHVTPNGWYLSCLATNNGGGFTAHAPNGDRYRFDTPITRSYQSTGTARDNVIRLRRQKHILAASEVTDVNGNWVRYNYDSQGRLLDIRSNDGRRIDLRYQGASKLISRVIANGRVWRYSYNANTHYSGFHLSREQAGGQTLDSVTLPDGRAWSFNLDAMIGEPGRGRQCTNPNITVSLTHPYGTSGRFELAETSHRQSRTWTAPREFFCALDPATSGTPPDARPPVFIQAPLEAYSVTSKVLTIPGASTARWTYRYEADSSENPPPTNTELGDLTNWTLVRDPLGNENAYFHYWNDHTFGGQLARKEMYQGSRSNNTRLEVMQLTHIIEKPHGTTFATIGPVPSTVSAPLRTTQVRTTRNGETYTTTNAFNSDIDLSNYSFGFPLRTTKFSTLSNDVRTVDIRYRH